MVPPYKRVLGRKKEGLLQTALDDLQDLLLSEQSKDKKNVYSMLQFV